MRILSWVGAVIALGACGGRIEQGVDDDSVPVAPAGCAYGQLATTNDSVLSLASTGDTIFELNVNNSPGKNNLSAIAKDGTVRLVHTSVDQMLVVGSRLAFIQREANDQGLTTSATLSLLDPDGTTSTIDSFTRGDTYNISDPATDGEGSLYWYRSNNTPPARSRFEIVKRSADATITTQSTDPSFAILGTLTTDGMNLYATAITYGQQEIFGRLSADGSIGLTLARSSADPSYDAVGVDEDDIVYEERSLTTLTTNLWVVPKSGGSPTKIASDLPLPAASAALLLDHHVYYANGASIVRVATHGSHATKVIATAAATALTTDACGIVYATPNSDGSAIYRATF